LYKKLNERENNDIIIDKRYEYIQILSMAVILYILHQTISNQQAVYSADEHSIGT